MAVFDRFKKQQSQDLTSLSEPQVGTVSDLSTLRTDTVHGRLELQVQKMLTGWDSSLSEGAETPPAIRAARLLLPRLFKHLKDADEEVIKSFCKSFADAMNWVANGDDVVTDVGTNLSEEIGEGVASRGDGNGEVDVRGIPDSSVSQGVSESPDSGDRLETPVHGAVAPKRAKRQRVVQTVGSRSVSSELGSTSGENESDGELERGVEA